MSRLVTLKQVEQSMKNAAEAPNVSEKLYTSLDNLIRCILAIVDSNGQPGWSASVVNQENQPLFQENERAGFEKAFQPFIEIILASCGNKDKSLDLSAFPQTMEMKGGSLDMDGMFNKVVDYIGSIDRTVQTFAGDNGIIAWETSYDKAADDPHPLTPLGWAVSPLFPAAPTIAAKIPVPARAIVFLSYLAMDVTRLIIGFSPIDWPTTRKLLSLMLSIIDLLKGDWKKAILSFSGYFSQNYVIFGTYSKVFLDIFMLLSPEIRDTMVRGSYNAVKSLICGSLLFLFETFSPAEVREPVEAAFEVIQEVINENNKILASEVPALPPMPGYLTPSFTHIQNLQAFVANPALICSTNFQDDIKPVLIGTDGKKNSLIRFVLNILRVPTDPDTTQEMCGDKLGKTFTQITVDDRLKAREEMRKQMRGETSPMPSA